MRGEVDGGDGPVVDVEVGDHLEIRHSGKARVSIPQAAEVGFIKDVNELGLEGEVGVLDLTEDAELFLVLVVQSETMYPRTSAEPQW